MSIVEKNYNIFDPRGPPIRFMPGLPDNFFRKNKGSVDTLIYVKHLIFNNLSSTDDPSLLKIVNAEIPVYYLSQDIYIDKIEFHVQKKKDSFINILEYMSSALLVMTSNNSCLEDRIYILNYIEEPGNYTFSHVSTEKQLTQFQWYFYYLVLNYQIFVEKLDDISFQLMANSEQLNDNIIRLSFLFVYINYVIYLLIDLFIYIFRNIIKY